MKKIFSLFVAALMCTTLFADVTKIYCKADQAWWTEKNDKGVAGAVAAHYWNGAGASTTWPGVRMEAVEGEKNIFVLEIDPEKAEHIIFVRVPATGDLADWGAKTKTQDWPEAGKDLFTITNETAVWGDPGCDGEWSKFVPSEEPIEPETPAKFYVTGDSALVVDAGLTADKKWNPDALKSEKDTFALTLKANQDYQLKVTVDGTWDTPKGFDLLTDTAAGLKPVDGTNIGFKLKTAGEVKVIYTDKVFKLIGDFVVPEPEPEPEVPVIKIAGDFNGWTATALTAGETTASIKVNLDKAQNWGFKMVVGDNWLSAGEQGVEYKRGDAAIAVKHVGGVDNNVFIVADVVGEYTITWTYADSTVAVTFPELPEITLEDGYYVIGLTGWSIYSLDASLKFEANADVEGEYILKNIELTEGQEMKVVEVKDKKLGAWYGMKDDKNYKITADVAGTRDIYFRTAYNETWEGHIFVNWQEPTAIDNTAVDSKAVKTIENGMLIIRREGKTYNVLGVEIR